MIAIRYMNADKKIFQIIENVISYTDNEIIAANEEARGFDKAMISFLIVDTTTMKVGDVLTEADLLPLAKAAKMQELIAACNNAILGRFKSTIGTVTYGFSHDGEAQSNFNAAARAFDKAFTTSEDWTAYDSSGKVVRVTLNAADFDTVYKDKMLHVKNNVSKLRDTLQPNVEAALDVPAVNAIVW